MFECIVQLREVGLGGRRVGCWTLSVVMGGDTTAFAFNQVALGASAAIGIYLLVDEMVLRKKTSTNERSCGSCGGTGYIDCFCTKWDFSAVSPNRLESRQGCGNCRGSLKEKCPSCNGKGGLPVELKPAMIRKRVDDGRPLNFVKVPRALQMPIFRLANFTLSQ